MDTNRIKPAINNKRKPKKYRKLSNRLLDNDFEECLTLHPTRKRDLCIQCNVDPKTRKNLIRHIRSISHREKIIDPLEITHEEKANSVEHLQSVTREENEVCVVKEEEYSQWNTYDKEIFLAEDSQLYKDENETISVEYLEPDIYEEKPNLDEHLQPDIVEEIHLVENSQICEKDISLNEDSQMDTYAEETTLVEDAQSIIYIENIDIHEEKIDLVDQLQLITHIEKPILVEHSQLITHEGKAISAESPQLNIHKEQKNSAIHSQLITHKSKPNLVVSSESVKPKEKAISQNIPQKDINNDNSRKNKIKEAEIKLSAFLVQHNIPFQILEKGLLTLIKDITKNPKVVTHLSLMHNESTNDTQVTEECVVDEMIKNLQTCKFSILIDENNINSRKNMSVFVQYVSPQDKRITKQMLKLISTELTEPGDIFFKELKKLFEDRKIPMQNIVAVVCNNATPSGWSVMKHLKLKIPKLVVLNCIGHLSTIIVNSAYARIPQSCEYLIQEVISYISDNIEESTHLNRFRDIFNTETKTALKSPNTKWLVLHECIVRLTENWDVLKNYFIFATVESNSKSAVTISKLFNNNSTRAYLLFLKYSLKFFNHLNEVYQSCRFLSHVLLEDSRKLIHAVASNFIAPSALKNIANINLEDHKNILNIDDIYVGPECKSYLSTLPPEYVREIKIQCRDFYATAVYKMLVHLPYKDTMFEQLMFLQPKIALYYDGRKKIKNLTSIATCTGHPDITKLAYEWMILPTIYSDAKKEELAALEIDEMWKEILKYEDANGDKMFSSLGLLVESVLSFPHSNFVSKNISSMATNVIDEKDT